MNLVHYGSIVSIARSRDDAHVSITEAESTSRALGPGPKFLGR